MNAYERIYTLLTEAKSPASHGADVFHKKLGNAGPGETKRAEAALKASKEATERRRKRQEAVKFKRGQKIFGKYKGFVPGTPESRPTAASEPTKPRIKGGHQDWSYKTTTTKGGEKIKWKRLGNSGQWIRA